MGKAKWIVLLQYTMREAMEKTYRDLGENPKDYNIDDINDCEISVIREDNKHGINSYGWFDENKILIDDTASTKSEFEKAVRRAKNTCKFMNREDGFRGTAKVIDNGYKK